MKIDRRFLDISFCIKGIVSTEDQLPTDASIGDFYMGNGCSGGCDNIFKYNGTTWEELKPENTQTEFFNLVTGDIIKSNGSFWNIIGTIHSYIVVNDILEDKVGESNSNETHKNGDKYLKTTDGKIYTYNGTTWTAESYVASNGQYLSKYDFYVYIKNNNKYTSVPIANGTIILNQSNLSLYAYNETIGLIKLSTSGTIIIERHTIINDDLSNNNFVLSNHIQSGTEAQILVFVNGVLQEYNVDYSIYDDNYEGGTRIEWENKTFKNVLKAGDKFTVQYLV